MESMNHMVWVMKMHHWLMVDPIVTHYCPWRLRLSQRSPEPPRVLCSTGEEREKTYSTAESLIRTIARCLQAFRARADRRPSHQRTRRVRDPRLRGVRDASCWPARRFSNAPPPFALNFSYPNDDPRPAFNHYLCCPFNNSSTFLHNFNSRSLRRTPLINSLIDGTSPSPPAAPSQTAFAVSFTKV